MKFSLTTIPLTPLIVLVLYALFTYLQYSSVIADNQTLMGTMMSWYNSWGLWLLFIAGLLSTLAYVSIYLPAPVFIAVAIFATDGYLWEFSIISVVVTLSAVMASVISYYVGYLCEKEPRTRARSRTQELLRGHNSLFALGFYYFHRGHQRKPLNNELLITTAILLPYSVVICYLVYPFKSAVSDSLNYYILAGIVVWFVIATYRKKKVQLSQTTLTK